MLTKMIQPNLNSLKSEVELDPEILCAYQRYLIYACLEGVAPIGCLGGLCGGQFGPGREKWKVHVANFIFLNMSVGFFELSQFGGVAVDTSPIQIRNLLLADDSKETMDFWFVLQFFGTEKLSAILNDRKLLNWDAFQADPAPDFIGELMKTYANYKIIK